MSLYRYLRDVGKQDEREERVAKVERNPRLDALVAAYERWLQVLQPKWLTLEEAYDEASRALSGLVCSASDIAGFMTRLPDYEVDPTDPLFWRTGVFVSAAINHGCDARYDVFTEGLLLDYLGYRNSKHLVIHGDVGTFFPEGLSGELHLDGDYLDISSFTPAGGTLYHRGQLICQDGATHGRA